MKKRMAKVIVVALALLFWLRPEPIPAAAEPRPDAQAPATAVKGPYLGQTPPGRQPELFAPEMISLPGTREHSLAYSPKGDEIFFTRGKGWPTNQIMHMKRIGDSWSQPDSAAFLKGAYAVQPCFSPDGQCLYFSSSYGKDDVEYYTVWRVRKTGDDWSEPEEVADMGGAPMQEYHPSVGPDGTLYFLYWDFNAQTGDIWMSKQMNGKHVAPVRLEAPISTENNEVRPTVAPDGMYLLFESDRPGGFGDTDLYICLRNPDGTWSAPMNLGPEINTPGTDDSPNVSPDGKYWFFCRDNDIYWRDAIAALEGVFLAKR